MARRWRRRQSNVSRLSQSQAISDQASHPVRESADAPAQELLREVAGKICQTNVSRSSQSGAINDEQASLPIPVSVVASTRSLPDETISVKHHIVPRSSQSEKAPYAELHIARLASAAAAQGSPCETSSKKRRTNASRSCQSQAMNHEAALPIPESTDASVQPLPYETVSRNCQTNVSWSSQLQAITDDSCVRVTRLSNALARASPDKIVGGKCQIIASQSSLLQAMNESSNAPGQSLPVESVGRKDRVNASQSSRSHSLNEGTSIPIPESTDAPAQSLQDEPLSSAVDLTSTRKRTRGKTRNIQLLLLPRGQKLPLEFNNYGQPIGPHTSKFSSYLGNLVRNGGSAPISLLHWENVTEEKREKIYNRLLEKFEFEETPLIKGRIMQKMGKKFSDHKYHLKHEYYDKCATTEERIENVPKGVSKDDWAAFVSYHDMEETKEKCAKNKCNRAKQVIVHYTGTKSYAQIRAEESQKDPEHHEPSQLKMFRIAYTKSNGFVGSSAAQEILDQFENLSNQLEDSSSSKGEDEIYRQIIGPERHGRVPWFWTGSHAFFCVWTWTESFQAHEPTQRV